MTTPEPVYYDRNYIDPSYVDVDYLWREVVDRGGSNDLKEVSNARTNEESERMEWVEIRRIFRLLTRSILRAAGKREKVAILQIYHLLIAQSLSLSH